MSNSTTQPFKKQSCPSPPLHPPRSLALFKSFSSTFSLLNAVLIGFPLALIAKSTPNTSVFPILKSIPYMPPLNLLLTLNALAVLLHRVLEIDMLHLNHGHNHLQVFLHYCG